MESLIASGQLPALLGILVAIFGIMLPIVIVIVVFHFRHQRWVETMATVRHLGEKGMPVPAQLLGPDDGERRRHDPRAMLVTAMTMVGAGLGLMIFFYAFGLHTFWGIGALVGLIGVAQLIALRIAQKMPDSSAGVGPV
jgi:hypothetical protein